jgi:AcrR family transcriptional regulator
MRITNDRSGRSRGTASADRREQIVTATIQMLATHGYVGTSFDSVVAHAGLSSKRLITYHFQTKEQLYEDVIAQIARTAADFMTPLIGMHTTRRNRLRAYITANIQFIAEFPEHVWALQEIVAHLPRVSAARAMTDEALDRLVDAFLDGQRAGEFRAFDPLVMAVSLRASIDAAAGRLQHGADPAPYAQELATAFDLATSASGAAPTSSNPETVQT